MNNADSETRTVTENEASQFDPCYYVSPSLLTLPTIVQDYSQEFARHYLEESAHAQTAPIDIEVVHRPAAIRQKALPIATTTVNSISPAGTNTPYSDLHPLPVPPATPSLGSAPRFFFPILTVYSQSRSFLISTSHPNTV